MSRPFRAVLLAILGLLITPGWVRAWSTTLVGDRRVDVDATLELREVFEVDRNTPHDRTQELLRVRAAGELAPWLRFESTTVGINGGPSFAAQRGGTFNFKDAFQSLDPSIEFEEAFLDFDFEPLHLRVGKQKFYWGKLDRFQPNDLMNTYQYRDPFMEEQYERKIGVPALSVTYAAPERDWLPAESTLTMGWAPIYVPFRFPEPGDRWFPPAAEPSESFHVPGGLIVIPGMGPLPAFDVPLGFQTFNADPPPRGLENSSLGLRATGNVRGADLGLYYFHGFDPQPAFTLLVEAFNPDPSRLDITAQTTLLPVYRRIDSWGADAAYTLGDFTLRAEGAYVRGRPFARDLRLLVTDPTQLAPQINAAVAAFLGGATSAEIDIPPGFVQRNAIEWGTGVDYSYEGWFALLQINQTDVLDNDVDLLIADVETRLVGTFRKDFLRDLLHANLVGVQAFGRGYTMLLPRLTYDITDWLDVRVGYLAIMGSRFSPVGQYKENDQAFVRTRMTW